MIRALPTGTEVVTRVKTCSSDGNDTKGDCFHISTSSITEEKADCFTTFAQDKPCFYVKCEEITEEIIRPLPEEIDLSSYGVILIYGMHATEYLELYVACSYDDPVEGTIDAICKFWFLSANDGGIYEIVDLSWVIPMPEEIDPPEALYDSYKTFQMHGTSSNAPIAIAAGDVDNTVHFISHQGVYLRELSSSLSWYSSTEYLTRKVNIITGCPEWSSYYPNSRMVVTNVENGQERTVSNMRGQQWLPGGDPAAWTDMTTVWADSDKEIAGNIYGTYDDYTAVGRSVIVDCEVGTTTLTWGDDATSFGDDAPGEVFMALGDAVLYDGTIFGGRSFDVTDGLARFKSAYGFNSTDVYVTSKEVPYRQADTMSAWVYMHRIEDNKIKQVTIGII